MLGFIDVWPDARFIDRMKTSTRRRPPALAKLVSDIEAVDMVAEMMAIPGGSGQEAGVMEYIRGRLVDAGLPVDALVQDDAHRHTVIDGNVGNMVLKLPGTLRAPRRMLTAHTDTVPICIGSKPLRKGKKFVSGNPMTGLGADDRSGAAVLLATAMAILRGKLDHPPLTFVWMVQEEVGLQGARYANVGLFGKPKLAFNFDGGSPTKLTIGATGGYRMTITVRGIASHAGGAPAEGVSAIAIASLAIADLVKNGWHGQIAKGRHVGTSNVGVIHGGEATNVVTNLVTLRAEARSHEPAFRARIVKEIETAFERAAKAVHNTSGKHGSVKFEGGIEYEAFRLPSTDPSVVAAAAAVRAEKHDPELAVSNGGLDANWLSARGIPTVTLGCGQRNIHTVDEELDIPDFQLARRIALRLATGSDAAAGSDKRLRMSAPDVPAPS
jgi:tripeptide aminopeptidase